MPPAARLPPKPLEASAALTRPLPPGADPPAPPRPPQKSKPAALDKILDAETRGFISLCLEHDHGVRPSAEVLSTHEYLATPLGGPGSDDDKPVEVQPRDGARADPSAPATAVAAVPGPAAADVPPSAPGGAAAAAPAEADASSVAAAEPQPGRAAESAPRPVAGLGPERLLNGQQPHVQLASTPPRIVMSQSQAAVPGVPGAPMELSCQVLIDGESKTVSFPMDFATDTPESVAREMVEELGIPETEETIADIVAQIKSVRPAADGAGGVTHLEPTREEAVGGTQFHMEIAPGAVPVGTPITLAVPIGAPPAPAAGSQASSGSPPSPVTEVNVWAGGQAAAGLAQVLPGQQAAPQHAQPFAQPTPQNPAPLPLQQPAVQSGPPAPQLPVQQQQQQFEQQQQQQQQQQQEINK